jgi:carbon monoxide dehydrogenase subunit G
MTTKVDKSILVNVPIGTAYNQWTQFEDFPQFMNGVKSVTHISDDRLEWVAEIAGIRRQWEARILEQVPDRKVAWAATGGATNAGSVEFEDVGGSQTSVHLFLEYEPEGLVEKVGDKLNVVENQAEGDLERFKAFIESEGYATGAWRGAINEGVGVGTPGVEHADASRGDSGKAGVSPGAVAAGVGLAAAAAAGIATAVNAKKSDTEDVAPLVTPATPVSSVESTPVTTSVESTSVESTPVSTGVDAPVSGSYSEPHVLTEEDIEARTPDEPLAGAEHVHDTDGTDSVGHSHDTDGTDGTGGDTDGTDSSARF